MKRVLKKNFFERDTLVVAEELLGKYLVRKTDAGASAYKITETEAYDGPDDLASHARRGKTPRTSVMFGDAGFIYVYFVYGMHDMLNIVTGPKDYPAAILIRGVEGISGPGRVTKALEINRELNEKKLGKESGLWIEDRGEIIDPENIERTPRIGIAYAGMIWTKKLYRFVLKEK